MRIAFFSDNFYPELSGITGTILITGRELAKRGHAICYVAPSYSQKNYWKAGRGYPTDPEHEAIDGMPIIRLPSLPVSSPTGQSRFAPPFGGSISGMEHFRPDVIHTQSPYGVGWEAVRAARRLGVPVVGTNHTAIEDFFPVEPVVRAYDAWYYNHCDFVTAPYQGLITRMQEKGFKKPARAVPNPVNLADFVPASPEEKTEIRKSFGISGPAVLYVGRLGVEKHIDVTLRAIGLLVERFPTITFVATGHGAAEEGLRTLARELGIRENVRFTGFLSSAALPHAYHAADTFAMTSTSDSQSLALMQGYASGLPAVCVRARGLPDYTPSTCGFLVEPNDHRAVAEKLSLLLSDGGLRERMGRAAQTYAKQFSPEIIASEWEGVYRSVIERAGA